MEGLRGEQGALAKGRVALDIVIIACWAIPIFKFALLNPCSAFVNWVSYQELDVIREMDQALVLLEKTSKELLGRDYIEFETVVSEGGHSTTETKRIKK